MGRIGKAHGLAGDVVVDLTTDRTARLDVGATLHWDGGTLVVESARPFQGRFLVHFTGVTDRTGAERLRGALLRAPALEEPDTLWVHQLVGARVVGVDGAELGIVAAVEANPASDLLVLEGGGLVPMRFVTAFEPGVRVTVDIPAGLLD